MSALLVHIGISLYAGAKVLEEFFGIHYVLSIVGISVITAIYTILGGLRAVMITDAIQAVLLLTGAAILTLAAPQLALAVMTFTQLDDDTFLVSHRVKLWGSRAQALILAGKVLVNGATEIHGERVLSMHPTRPRIPNWFGCGGAARWFCYRSPIRTTRKGWSPWPPRWQWWWSCRGPSATAR